MSKKTKVAIIGKGKAGSYLDRHFGQMDLEVHVFTKKDGDYYEQLASGFDIIFLCVPDQIIPEVSELIPSSSSVILHISGTTSLDRINSKHLNTGIFWPLMSLNNETESPIGEIPFCLEASNENSKTVLTEFVNDGALKHYWTTETQRQKLHLAAVMSQNFSNHLFHLAYKLVNAEDLDFEMFKPILLESAKRVGNSDPARRQTGPAARNDERTMAKHLEMLDGKEKDIYELLSQSIRETK